MEIENLNLKSRLEQLEAQANKYFHMKLQKDVMDKKISKLHLEMALKQRSMRKLKSKTAKFRKDISEKSSSLKKMEHHLKKIWSLLLALGNKLRRNGLLTMEEKDKLRIGYEEWFILLVSQDKRKTEEVLNMLNDLPLSLFEVLNDSNYCTQKYDSKLNEACFDKEQNVIPSSSGYSTSILQVPKDVASIEDSFSHIPVTELSSKYYNDSFVTPCRLSVDEPSNDHNIITPQSVLADDSTSILQAPKDVASIEDSFSHTPDTELSFKYNNDDCSSTESEGDNSFVTACRLSVDEPSNDHNIITSQSVFSDDSETDRDVFDHKSLKLNATSCDSSNNICQDEPVKSFPNNLLKIAPDENKLKLFGNLKDQSDTESCNMKESELTTYKLHVSGETDDQEVSVNIAISPSNEQTDSTSSQMSLVESSVLNALNISTTGTSTHCNLNIPDFIPKKNIVGSKNVIDNSKCDSKNSSICTNKISDDTIIVKDSKTFTKKIVTQLTKRKLRRIVFGPGICRKGILVSESRKSSSHQNKQSQTILKKEKSLHYNYESKVNHPPQNDDILNDHAKNKRTTIMLPGPPMKVCKKSKQCLTEKNDLELQDNSYPLQQNFSPTSSVKRFQQFSLCSFPPKKKPKAILSKGTCDIAPVRVKGRTLINKRTLRKKHFEVEKSNDVGNECHEANSKVDQTLKNESEVVEDQSMSECNLIPTTKPRKIRKEHKGNLQKDSFTNIWKNTDKARLASSVKKQNSSTNETETYFLKSVSQKQVDSSKDILNDLLKKAELSRAEKDVRMEKLPLVKLFKLKSKKRNLTRYNTSKYDTFKKGITSVKSKAFISNINKSHCTEVQPLEIKKESTYDMNEAFDQTKGYSSDANKVLRNEIPVTISENETKDNINSRHNIVQKEISLENANSDPRSFTVMKENTFIESEAPTSIGNINMQSIGGKSTQCTIKCDFDNKTALVAAKTLDDSLKNINSEENCISENDSEFEGNLVIDENLDNAKSLISNKNHDNSSEESELDVPNENYISTSDLDFDSNLVIDENFSADEQCLISEEKHDKPQDKNGTINKEHNDYLSCSDVNVSEHITKEHIPIVCRQTMSNVSNTCGTSMADEGTKNEVISSRSVMKEFVSPENIPLTQSLQSVKIAVGVKKKPKVENHLNEQQKESSACENKGSKYRDKTFALDTSIKSNSAKINLKHEIIEKGAQEKRPSIHSAASKSKKKFTKKRKDSPKFSCNVTKSLPEKFFQEFRNVEFTEENFKRNSRNLFNFLINPTHFPNNSELLFHVLNYLQATKKNLLLSYSANKDSSVLLPLDEICIVRTIFMIESKKKLHLEGLIKISVTTIHHLIISNKKICIYGLAALCRVLTAICKEERDSLKPVILCGDILKMKHQFAPYLIASIAGTWKELFQLGNNLPAEEVLFHSCILHGASKRTNLLVECNWKSSIEIISEYFTALPVKNSKSAINMLKECIQFKCEEDSSNNQYLSLALIILAGYEDWLWTKENLLTEYIIPNLNKYGHETLNENAFDLYCNMYVDALLLSPGNPLDTVLVKFFNSSTSLGNNFVRDSAALALVRFVYKKNRMLPPFLSSWLKLNKENPKLKQIEPECDRWSMAKS